MNTIDKAQFLRDFDLMGLQRQMKVIGIFARLAIRDNKPDYLADIPGVMRYFFEVSRGYDELRPFVSWFDEVVMPIAASKIKLIR
jgi:aminoglycoside/choline kinase family phosphotransferase